MGMNYVCMQCKEIIGPIQPEDGLCLRCRQAKRRAEFHLQERARKYGNEMGVDKDANQTDSN